MSRAVPHLLLVLVVYLFCARPADAQFDMSVFGGGVGVSSDYVFRGVSQTMGQSAVEAYVDATFDSGLYAYVWASNVDFVPEGEPDDGVGHEVDMSVGYFADLTDRWAIDLALIRYMFPGAASGVNYNYNELMTTAWLDETHSAAIAFSPNVDGTGKRGTFYKLGTGAELAADLNLDLELGHYDLREAYGASYSYVQAALRKSIDRWSIEVTYANAFGGADEIYYRQATGSRLVFSLLYQL